MWMPYSVIESSNGSRLVGLEKEPPLGKNAREYPPKFNIDPEKSPVPIGK